MTRKAKKSESDLAPLLREFKPKTKNQHDYIRSIVENEITLVSGPAGSGKSSCATAIGCEYLIYGKVQKLVITRPAIEAGRSLGAIPGSVDEKMTPYIVPIMEEIKLSIGNFKMQQFLKDGTIEIAPINYIRGRNFHECFVIADEMSNATYSEIKLILTRIGMNSKMILTGDIKQSDLPMSQQGSLDKCMKLLENINSIGIVRLHEEDIVRNPIIAKILERLN